MGVDNIIQKRKTKSNSGIIKFTKNNKIKKSETLDNKKVSSMIDNFNVENEILDNRTQPKPNKIIYSNQKPSDETPKKSKREDFQNLKSFSVQNLVKIENHNLEEAFPGSLDTNDCSNKSKEEYNNILNDKIYEGIGDNNSFDEKDEESEENEEEEENEENENDESDEEKKKKDLIVTNNMKTVFIDSKLQNKEKERINEISRLSSLSTTTFDYELNFYRNGNDIRQSYLEKLISTKVWIPNMKPKQHNSIIIFDWDDTLLPTSFLTPGGIFNENMNLSDIENEKLLKLEQAVFKLLTEAVKKGNVYIITNAGHGWVEYSANRFYPSIMPILEKIKIISARGEYEKIFPGNSRQWKIEAFLNLQENINIKLVTNIICIGDSLFEMEAGRILASKFKEAFIKTIKFREAPKLDELLKQLKLVCAQFGSIYLSIKNLTIRVERKKKEGI